MPDLILPSLEIQNFRAFEHLRIERLGRVNLITGKNNVGKTSLLEALYLYARDGSAVALSEMLETRDELNRASLRQQASDNASAFRNLKYIFYGRKELAQIEHPLSVGPISGDKVKISVVSDVLPHHTDNDRRTFLDAPVASIGVSPTNDTDVFIPYISVMSRKGELRAISAGFFMSPNLFVASESRDIINCRFVKLTGWKPNDLSRLWDNIALTAEEDEIVKDLRIITPVQRIGFRDRQDSTGERFPVVLLAGATEPVSLRSLGEGMNRLFGIALALTAARDGILLIDEVETGLHYSVMPDVWKLIFQVAERLNVQVFATTHSWDCIEAFERAAREDDTAQAELIHLIQKNDRMFAVLYDKEELGIVTDEMIEVR